jgi:hypothetical protein
MLADFSNKLEITFWDIYISVLSKATWLKWPIGHILHILKDEKLKTKCLAALIIACAGLTFGILLFILL